MWMLGRLLPRTISVFEKNAAAENPREHALSSSSGSLRRPSAELGRGGSSRGTVTERVAVWLTVGLGGSDQLVGSSTVQVTAVLLLLVVVVVVVVLLLPPAPAPATATSMVGW